eukprot:CAMPEP_0194747306 /NCGR_PEP_ID=MMETSP0323_2-20130528/1371_1 /TAXON_ID=2866 ORGANISM="Crypthecodinium cohnii, Strain Seligo" /NCGR_SAMPLE_ID=MMETSP0323_2 /ASSEMBLY_ACC=CAM_ASM_000346 /LENGTH=89 /DNA_ID=CAMNT_0039660527 /DNA_START=217 /DNA_END=487 /DNA_ORIENTATION=-
MGIVDALPASWPSPELHAKAAATDDDDDDGDDDHDDYLTRVAELCGMPRSIDITNVEAVLLEICNEPAETLPDLIRFSRQLNIANLSSL